MIDSLVHGHFVVDGVSLRERPQSPLLRGVLFGGKHSRYLVSTNSFNKNELNGNRLQRLVFTQEKEHSGGVGFAVWQIVDSFHPWEEKIMMVHSEQFLLRQSLKTHSKNGSGSEFQRHGQVAATATTRLFSGTELLSLPCLEDIRLLHQQIGADWSLLITCLYRCENRKV